METEKKNHSILRRYIDVLVHRPCFCFCFWLLIYPAIFVSAILLGASDFTIASDLSTYIRADVESSIIFDAFEATKLAIKNENVSRRRELFGEEEYHHARFLQSSSSSAAPRTLESFTKRFRLNLFYVTRDHTNIFTETNLEKINIFEKKLIKIQDWEKFCAAPSQNEITTYSNLGLELKACGELFPEKDSIMNFFYPTVNNSGGGNIASISVLNGQGSSLADITSVLDAMTLNGTLFYMDRLFLERNKTSNMTRSAFNFGSPIAGFDTNVDYFKAQVPVMNTWLKEVVYPFLVKESTSSEYGNVRIVWYQDELGKYEVEQAVYHDAFIGLGSLVFVYLYIWFQVGSFWIASLGILGIIYSFPLAYATFYIVFGVKVFMILNVMALFIAFGVGADDIFVFYELFSQSITLKNERTEEPFTMSERIHFAYSHGGMAILLTSATTAASFFANAASVIVPIREFGIFLGLVISFNYIVVVTLFPAAVVFHEYGLCSRRGYLATQARRLKSLKGATTTGASNSDQQQLSNRISYEMDGSGNKKPAAAKRGSSFVAGVGKFVREGSIKKFVQDIGLALAASKESTVVGEGKFAAAAEIAKDTDEFEVASAAIVEDPGTSNMVVAAVATTAVAESHLPPSSISLSPELNRNDSQLQFSRKVKLTCMERVRRVVLPKRGKDTILTKEQGHSFLTRFFANKFGPYLRRTQFISVILCLIGPIVGAYISLSSINPADVLPQFFQESKNYGVVLDLAKEFDAVAPDAEAESSGVIVVCNQGSGGDQCANSRCLGEVSPGVYCGGPSKGICCENTNTSPVCAGKQPFTCVCQLGYQSPDCLQIQQLSLTAVIDACPCSSPSTLASFKNSVALQFGISASSISVNCVSCSARRRQRRQLLVFDNSDESKEEEQQGRRFLASAVITITVTASNSVEFQNAQPITSLSVGSALGNTVIQQSTANPTKSPTTSTPTTLTPTKSPTVKAPTSSPVTSAPTTKTPTKSPVTNTPTTAAPVLSPVLSPPTNSPVTKSPTTSSPTKSPTTSSPTHSPTTSSPTNSPTTSSPTNSPTTSSPTTGTPTSSSPTKNPVTESPTKLPTTGKPTTSKPTTKAPTIACQNGGTPNAGICQCPTGFSGPACEIRTCPGFPSSECSGQGTCNEDGTCSCFKNFSGEECETFDPAELSDSETIQVIFTFGLKSIDRSETSADFPNGIPVFDEKFDPFTPDGQRAMLLSCGAFCAPGNLSAADVCDTFPFTLLRSNPTQYFGANPILLDSATKKSLGVRRLQRCLFGDLIRNTVNNNPSLSFPFEKEVLFNELIQLILANPGVEANANIARDYRNNNQRILLVSFAVQTNIDADLGSITGTEKYALWEAYAEKIRNRLPLEAKSLVQTSSTWARVNTESGAISGTLNSAIISFVFAIAAMILFTRNLWLTIHASIAILCIVALLVTFMFGVMKYSFGIIEAISITVFVGFSVDYCLHIVHAYQQAPGRKSYSKMKQGLIIIGSSIIGGAVTTIGASLLLLLCEIVVFQKFGLLLTVNSFLSIIYAFFFLVPLLMMLGPTGRNGDFGLIVDAFIWLFKKATCQDKKN